MEESLILIAIISISILILAMIAINVYFSINVGTASINSEDSEDSEDEYVEIEVNDNVEIEGNDNVEIEGNDYGPSEVDLMRKLRRGGLQERDCWGICRICNARGYNDCNKICRNCQKQSS
tara:strand:+ start:9932 stop:10294 length:363 start_codon:yes stop_codon:yes gene_type:complete